MGTTVQRSYSRAAHGEHARSDGGRSGSARNAGVPSLRLLPSVIKSERGIQEPWCGECNDASAKRCCFAAAFPLAGGNLPPLNISKTRVGATQDEPQGPLRVYPGGLAITRSVGNAEASESIIAVPDVSITAVPAEGARLVLASDGLWNALGNTCVGALCKQHPSLAACVDSLMEVSAVSSSSGAHTHQWRGGPA